MKKKTLNTLQYLFDRHPKATAIYRTSDGQYFTEKHFADAHASELKDQEIKTFEKRDVELAALLSIAAKRAVDTADDKLSKIEPVTQPADEANTDSLEHVKVLDSSTVDPDQTSVEKETTVVIPSQEVDEQEPVSVDNSAEESANDNAASETITATEEAIPVVKSDGKTTASQRKKAVNTSKS